MFITPLKLNLGSVLPLVTVTFPLFVAEFVALNVITFLSCLTVRIRPEKSTALPDVKSQVTTSLFWNPLFAVKVIVTVLPDCV